MFLVSPAPHLGAPAAYRVRFFFPYFSPLLADLSRFPRSQVPVTTDRSRSGCYCPAFLATDGRECCGERSYHFWAIPFFWSTSAEFFPQSFFVPLEPFHVALSCPLGIICQYAGLFLLFPSLPCPRAGFLQKSPAHDLSLSVGLFLTPRSVSRGGATSLSVIPFLRRVWPPFCHSFG